MQALPIPCSAVLLVLLHVSPARAVTAGGEIDFQRDIRPILSDACFHCHGPDKEERKGDVRLDTREGAFADLGGYHAIVPGKPEESEVMKLITAEDPDDRMPPKKSGRQLTAQQIELLKKWIAEGAQWGTHWAFEPVRAAEPPNRAAHAEHPIDRFVEARMQKEGLSLSPPEGKERLIRRVTLDLTGLPPTLAEVDAFLADSSAGAYEKIVDRLLASPHFGERMAMEWLDAARFADTNGYQTDETRDMSRWRDWVINAFNRNQPFDQFTIEQLAGDLLPNPTIEQRLATGFNRNHRINTEGGSIAEEFLVETVVDRVATTTTVWLGLTFECARCHDHKYDPISMRDFYQVYAFFNAVDETGLGDRDAFAARGKKGNTRPLLRLPTPELAKQVSDLGEQITATENELKKVEAEALPSAEEIANNLERNGIQWTVIEPEELSSSGTSAFVKNEDGSITVTGEVTPKESYTISAKTSLTGITGVRLEILPDAASAAVGRGPNGNAIISEFSVRAARSVDPDVPKPVKLQYATADFSQARRDVSGAIDGKSDTAWSFLPEQKSAHEGVFELAEPLGYEEGTALTFAIKHEFPKGETSVTSRFRISLTTTPAPYAIPRSIARILAVAAEKRSPAQLAELKGFQRARSRKHRELSTLLTHLQNQKREAERAIPEAMVMQDMEKPRDTFILKRGAYDQPGEKVTPGVPEWLLPMPEGAPRNRLGFAKWLVDPANPLPARVTVNRFWQMLFGSGLVKTVENFGSQAEPPSHPELLDWLAYEFVRSGWDVKHLIKQIVLSATYRQSSPISRELLERDPENRLLARGPRIRLQAEIIRDQALAVAGLLTRSIGGRSVRPYQPAGLWEEIAFDPKLAVYQQDHGPELYRRSMYTFWKRTVPPPTMMTFDAPSREVCVVQRQRTSTPLQALAVMNDPTFVEAARGLGQRMLREGGATPESRVEFAFRTVTARSPQPEELQILLRNYAKQQARFWAAPDAADKFLSVGESPRDADFYPNELAAATAVASLVLNLDEAITKE